MTNNLRMVDDLGRILAKIADLQTEADAIKDALREAGPGSYEGKAYRATVGEDGEVNQFDNAAIREKLIALGHRRFVNAHCETITKRGSVRCVARTGEETKSSRRAA